MSFLSLVLEALLPKRATHAHMAGITVEGVGHLLAPTPITLLDIDIVTLLPYRETAVRALVLEAKFHEDSVAFETLGAVLAEYLQSLIEESAFSHQKYVLIPIPLSKRRFRLRGYNQVEKIVRASLKVLPSSFTLNTTLLQRSRDTKAQTTLSRASRIHNMTEAFTVYGPIDSDSTYILIDDVCTTGATLAAASSCLKAAGVTRLELLALAH